MRDPSTERHPSGMSQEDLKTLRESDPSAFDDDAPAGAEDEGGGESGAASEAGDTAGEAAPAAAEAAPGAEGAAEAAAAAAGDAAGTASDAGAAAGASSDGGDKRPPAMVPRARLNEVIEQRDAAREIAEQNSRELAELRARLEATKAPKDFDVEFTALQAKYDAGEIEDGEFQREQTKLLREEAKHAATVAALETQAESLKQATERSWADEVKVWSDANPGFFAIEDAGNIFQRAINAAAALHGADISNADLLHHASRMAFELTGYEPPAGAAAAASSGADAAATRRAQNAARAAEGSTAPPPIAGGVGGRGGPERNIDVAQMKPGTFSKLSKDEQERQLGGPGAL